MRRVRQTPHRRATSAKKKKKPNTCWCNFLLGILSAQPAQPSKERKRKKKSAPNKTRWNQNENSVNASGTGNTKKRTQTHTDTHRHTHTHRHTRPIGDEDDGQQASASLPTAVRLWWRWGRGRRDAHRNPSALARVSGRCARRIAVAQYSAQLEMEHNKKVQQPKETATRDWEKKKRIDECNQWNKVKTPRSPGWAFKDRQRQGKLGKPGSTPVKPSKTQ